MSRIWQPLDSSRREIRLFILSPNKDDKAVPSGRLITRSLNQQLQYDAVSHAWGRASFPEVVVIDGMEWLVSTGIFEALQRLRHETEEQCFWIDAICVDQSDLQERAEQVKLMQHVFNRATNVQVWLGRNPTSIKRLIDDMNDDASLRQLFSQEKSKDEIQQDFSRLVDFVNLDYWGRVWVVQELALARSVRFLFGWKTFTLQQLNGLFNQFESAQRIGDRTQRYHIRRTLSAMTVASTLLHVATVGSLEKNATTLTSVLQRARLSQCYDPKDRIYGFLGIITAMFAGDFMEPDYKSSVAATYTDFVIRLVAKTGSLVVLNQAESICNSTIGLPTFVPDWSSRFQQHDAFSRLNTYSRYHASGKDSSNLASQAAADSMTSKLKCSGFIIGTVATAGECSRSIFGTPQSRMLASAIEGWQAMYNGKEDVFVRLITADRLGYDIPLAECLSTLEPHVGPRAVRNDVSITRDIIGNATSNRRFFLTSMGQPGLGPRDTREGDVVAILAGGRVPYVLRRSPNTRRDELSLFKFVGDCYVEGVMYGELLGGRDPPVFEDTWLE